MISLSILPLFFFTCLNSPMFSAGEMNNTTANSHSLGRKFNSVCGEVYTKREFVLESQGYPSNYPPDTDCSYLIKGPFCPTYFTLQFLDFNLEESLGCTKDRLEVENQDALCGSKSGTKTYFSNTGALKLRFRSDGVNSGRGFQIFVSRSLCGSSGNHLNPKEETDEVLRPKVNVPNLPNCCSNSYDAKTFFITSPNYPKSMNQVTDCKIQIKKNNPNVCRLRIHVLFFYLGAPMNPTCGQGYLQIDNKYLCDCKSDLKLISPFRDADVKDLRFRSNGLVSDSVTGFILEVIQDECPKRIDDTEKRFSSKILSRNSSIQSKIDRIEDETFANNKIFDKNQRVSEINPRISSIKAEELKRSSTMQSITNNIQADPSQKDKIHDRLAWSIDNQNRKSGNGFSSTNLEVPARFPSVNSKIDDIKDETSPNDKTLDKNQQIHEFNSRISSTNPEEPKRRSSKISSQINTLEVDTSPRVQIQDTLASPINHRIRRSGNGFSSNIPEDLPKTSTKESNFNNIGNETFHNDQIHRVAWPVNEPNTRRQENFANKLDEINEKTEVFDQDRHSDPVIVKHIYYFSAPEYDKAEDKEETSYIDTMSFGTVVRNAGDYNRCLNWNQLQVNLIYNRYGRNLPQCQASPFQDKGPSHPTSYYPNDNNNNNHNCVELNYLRGYFRSPCYPFYYPGNLDICYRIQRQPGMCSVRVHMQDFQLEDSWDCSKDFLSIVSFPYKYCGSRLSNTIFTLDLRYKTYEEVRFVTDAYYCGRGFYAVYEQIACQDMSYPINPVNPFPTPTDRPTPPDIYTTTTTSRPSTPCYSVSQEQQFQFDVFGDANLHRECRYEIRKFHPTVCRMELFVDTFNLFCPQEALFINGKRYCGQLNNQRIVLNNVFAQTSVEIIYRKTVNNANYSLTGLRARIYGKQYTDCTYPEVPPETELEEDFSKSVKARKKIASAIPEQGKYLIELRDKNFKDICKLVTSIQADNQPQDFCEILKNNTKAIKCTPVKEFYTLYTANTTTAAAANNQSNRLQLSNGRLVDEINYQEIDCEKLLQQ